MKRRHAVAIALALGSVGCLAVLGATLALALAQPGTPSIGWWVLGSGGAPASGRDVTMIGTLGQPVTGPSGGGEVSLDAGYQFAEVTIAKAISNRLPKPGQAVTYSVVVANSGEQAAIGAVLSDTVPEGLTFVGPVTLDPPGAGTVGTPSTLVRDATIAAGTAITVSFPVTVDTLLAQGTVITNTAALTSSEISIPLNASVPITVANARPALGTVDPSSSSGPTGVTTYFTTTWMDNNGWADLKQCYFHIGDSPSIVGNVTLMYNAAKDKLWLRTDDGSAWIGGSAPGSDNMMENGQAKVYCGLTTADGADGTLTVKWAIEFKGSYMGAKKLGLKCKDRSKARAKGKWKGTWTIE
jgi:uncharacterized repeat protein (TIGR01451 family)